MDVSMYSGCRPIMDFRILGEAEIDHISTCRGGGGGVVLLFIKSSTQIIILNSDNRALVLSITIHL